jgi:ubiquinone/menaquinone biosynthesis C-methylase UbiE
LGVDYDLFARAYPRYRELNDALSGVIAAYAPKKPSGVLKTLEIGCGSGITTSHILSSRPDLTVIAVDNEPKMVGKVSENLAGHMGKGRLQVALADAREHLKGTSDGAFEIIASGFTLHNMTASYRSELLAEIHRCLGQGGLFINTDKYPPDGDQERYELLAEQLDRFFAAFYPLEKYELLREWVLHNVADHSPERVMKIGEAMAEMESLGFSDVREVYRHGLEAVVAAVK